MNKSKVPVNYASLSWKTWNKFCSHGNICNMIKMSWNYPGKCSLTQLFKLRLNTFLGRTADTNVASVQLLVHHSQLLGGLRLLQPHQLEPRQVRPRRNRSSRIRTAVLLRVTAASSWWRHCGAVCGVPCVQCVQCRAVCTMHCAPCTELVDFTCARPP